MTAGGDATPDDTDDDDNDITTENLAAIACMHEESLDVHLRSIPVLFFIANGVAPRADSLGQPVS